MIINCSSFTGKATFVSQVLMQITSPHINIYLDINNGLNVFICIDKHDNTNMIIDIVHYTLFINK